MESESRSISTDEIRAWIRLIRPQHWIKNIVVFAAPLFALTVDVSTAIRTVQMFVAFSLIASAFYVANDLRDREADRLHPRKKSRPLAAGILSERTALVTVAVFLAIGVALGAFLGKEVVLVLLAYVVLQAAYNLGLKRFPILDVMVLGIGLVLRALGGAVAASVPVSEWFILCIGLLGLFLGIEKRKSERTNLGAASETRKVLNSYTPALLQRMESVVTAGALLAYSLWTVEGSHSIWMLATIPFVAYAIFRYQLITEEGNGEQPEKVLVSDPGILISVFVWLILVLFVFSLETTTDV